jgi:glycosyltransferase involved in cell wall biosynthesis
MSGGRSLRILMITLNSMWRGTFYRALHFARHLVQQGHTVTLLALSHQERWRFHTRDMDGVTLVETPDLLCGKLRSGWDLWDALARISWLRGHNFDLVHAIEARPIVIIPSLYMQRWRRVPLVLDWCDWFGAGGSVEERPNWLLRTVLRPVETFFEETFRTWADGTIVINTVLRQRAIDLGVPSETILLLPNGCDFQRLLVLDRDEARRALGLPLDRPLIGYIGAIFQRDAQLMACAFDLIKSALPRSMLAVIGYCNVDVAALVADPEAVIRTGFVSYEDMNRYLAACDLCWLPLRDTGANRGRWPGKLNDYMAAGRPVVATAVGDVATLLREHEIGLLAKDVPKDLAHQALKLLTDPERCAYLGRNARCVAEEVFDWALLSERLESFYDNVLGKEQT